MIFGPFLIENTRNLSDTIKFNDFVLHLLQTVWKNIDEERYAGMSKLMRFLWDTRYFYIAVLNLTFLVPIVL